MRVPTVKVPLKRWPRDWNNSRLPADCVRVLRTAGVPQSDLEMLAAEAATQWTGTFNPRQFDFAGALEVYEQAYSKSVPSRGSVGSNGALQTMMRGDETLTRRYRVTVLTPLWKNSIDVIRAGAELVRSLFLFVVLYFCFLPSPAARAGHAGGQLVAVSR